MSVLDLVKEETASSFSDAWYRVGPSRPRLSIHAHVIRQRFGDRTVYILEEPAGTQYYRISEAAYWWLALLDGSRSVDDAWRTANAQLAEDAPTQRECVELLARLQLYGLLDGDGPIAADMVALRRKQVATTNLRRRLGVGVSITMPLLNPEPFLQRTVWLWRAAFSWFGLVAWLTAITAGLYSILSRPEALFSQFNSVLDPSNLPWLGLVLILLRAWHELGHAAACKAMGARCTELGLMLVMFVLPFPYCDATASWRLPQTWRRVIVSSAGMLFETFVAALAAVIWSRSEPGLVRTLTFNTMLLSGVTTLVFNLNPLLRYDGYYILSDLVGIPNLWQRSRDLLTFLIEKLAFGVRLQRPPAVRSTGEFWFLLLYAICSIPYRVVVGFTIVLVIWSNPTYLTLGAVLAVVAAILFILLPVFKGLGYLLGSPRLMGCRPRAMAVVAGALVLVILALAVIPAPAAAYAPAIIRAEHEEPLRNDEAGFVDSVHVAPGQTVKAGQLLFTLRNPEVIATRDAVQAKLAEALARLDDAAATDPTRRRIEERAVEQARAELARAQDRVNALNITSPIDGQLVPVSGVGVELENVPGRFIQKGSLLAFVTTTDQMIIRAVVSDRDQAFVFPRGREFLTDPNANNTVTPSVRVRGQSNGVIKARIARFPAAGSRLLEAEALAAQAGGEIILDPTDAKQQTTLDSQFVVDLSPVDAETTDIRLFPGQRARVRFAIAPRPLVVQWWRRLSQVFAERSPI